MNYNSLHGPWLTPGLVERLTELHTEPEKLTYGQITSVLKREFPGLALTRSSVLAKCFRLGLPPRPDPAPVTKSKRSVEASHKRLTNHKRPASAIPWTSALIEPEQPPGKVTFAELRRRHCKWPSGSWPSITYCGDPRFEERPYCSTHCAMAYHAPNTRWV